MNNNIVMLIVFSILIFACKQRDNSTQNFSDVNQVPINNIKDQRDTVINSVQVFKSVRIPKRKNKLIDSLIIFGSLNTEFGFKYIDSILVYYKSNKVENIYKKLESNLENEIPIMYYDENRDCFAHFNNDNYLDIFLANEAGGSGGTCYNVFVYDKTLKSFRVESALSYLPNVFYVERTNHFISIGKSGENFIGAMRFIIIDDTIHQLSLFTSSYEGKGTTKYDSSRITYTYSIPNRDKKTEICYTWIDKKTDIEKNTCSKFMRKIENEIWTDWEHDD